MCTIQSSFERNNSSDLLNGSMFLLEIRNSISRELGQIEKEDWFVLAIVMDIPGQATDDFHCRRDIYR